MPMRTIFSKGFLLILATLLFTPTGMAQVPGPIQEAYFPKIIHTQGDVRIKQEPEPGKPARWMKAKKGMQIRPGARIKTTGKSQMDLGVPNKYQMRIKEKSDVVAGSLAFNTKSREFNSEYTIREGSIYNRIQKDYLGEFEIKSTDINITAIGTEYAINVWGPQQQTWVGLAQGGLLAKDKLDKKKFNMPAKTKIDLGEGENGKLEKMPSYELIGLRRELDKIGTGVDEDLDVRVFFILSYSSNRAYEFLSSAALLTNDNEPRRIKQLFIPTVKMLPNKKAYREKIEKNLKKIIFACDYYNDARYSPHFLSFAGAIYHLLGDEKNAIKLFKSTLKKYPNFQYASIIQCAIGIVYERFLDEPKKAIKAYREVISTYPRSLEVETAELGLIRLGE